jgi:signal transduction histidine kinase
MRSLRARLLVGSLLWMIALLAVANVVAVIAIRPGLNPHLALHVSLLAIMAVVFIAVGLSLVRKGLSPFDQLRDRLSAVRDGRASRVEGPTLAEVQPLVDELNSLLDDRERRIRQALSKAGDLAHGLKTPLAVLVQEVERAGKSGDPELAETLRREVERMRRQIDVHLAQARVAASGPAPGAACSVAEAAEALGRTLARLYAARGLALEVRVPAGLTVRARREDLDEMLGNLLDNACKWARSRVSVSSQPEAGRLVIVVDDDGPGLPPSMRHQVLQRGVRADEALPGSGLGLAIVRDLAELSGGSVSLEDSPMGGLRACLTLPAPH